MFIDSNPLAERDDLQPALPDASTWALLFARFDHLKVLVVGDVMLDRFIWGDVKRISPEAPVPVVEVQGETAQAGGAGNVANNMSALGATTFLLGVLGDDEHARVLQAELNRSGVDTSGIVVENCGATTVKTRVVAHAQQVVRVDRERGRPLSPSTVEELIINAQREAESVDVVVFSDYDKGVISQNLVEGVCQVAKRRGVPIIANPKPRNLEVFRRITAVSLNQSEAEQAAGFLFQDEADLRRAGELLLKRLEVLSLIITMGGNGLMLFEADQEPFHSSAIEVPVFDVAGAGDTMVSAFAMALGAGADARVGVKLANIAAGTVVKKVGVSTVTCDEILHLLENTQEIK